MKVILLNIKNFQGVKYEYLESVFDGYKTILVDNLDEPIKTNNL